jgi:hypothetical protein
MKTRLSVFASLALCAVLSTWGSKVWAGVCANSGPGGSCMLGQYSCTGTGIYDDGDSKEDSFSSSGVLSFIPVGDVIFSPNGAGWIFNDAGEPQFDITVVSGSIAENGTSGQGQLHLVWFPTVNAEFDFDGDKVAVPEGFNYVVNNVVNGVASEFTLQAIPGDDELDLIWLLDCRLQ